MFPRASLHSPGTPYSGPRTVRTTGTTSLGVRNDRPRTCNQRLEPSPLQQSVLISNSAAIASMSRSASRRCSFSVQKIAIGTSMVLRAVGVRRKASGSAFATSRLPGRHLSDLQCTSRRIRARASLEDVGVHDLRPQLRLAGSRARRGPADLRPAPRSLPRRDERALCAPRAGFGQGILRVNCRHHRRRYSIVLYRSQSRWPKSAGFALRPHTCPRVYEL